MGKFILQRRNFKNFSIKMVQNQCAEVKLPHRNADLPNAINSVNLFYEIRTRKHDHIPCPDSAGARKGAKGSRKGGVRAVLGHI